MASLKPRRGIWYARVQWWIGTSRKEKLIALRTKSRVNAMERMSVVNKVEGDIKQGMEFSFPWLDSTSTVTKVKRFTLKDASDQWLIKRKKLRKTTLTINRQSLGYLIDCLGKNKPIELIINTNIDEFIEYLESKGLSATSINIHLRSVKAMFRYWLKRERINKMPLIEQLSIRKTEPNYITDTEFHNIMQIEWLDSFYKRVFLLYRESGMRLREPMMSLLEIDWLDIPNESKGKVGRNIELDSALQAIFIDYKEWLDNGYGSRLKDPGDHISKMFKKALVAVGANDSKHFHSLRHTFAVRRLIQGTSIYDLKLLMGHSSVTTTEQYSNMNLKRVSQDFPIIAIKSQNIAKIGKEDTVLEDTLLRMDRYVA